MKDRRREMDAAVRGAGELASGIIRRLSIAGFRVVALEKEQPECVRRAVCFAEAVYGGEVSVEGVIGKLAVSVADVFEIADKRMVPILIDVDGGFIRRESPEILIDARMLKRDIDTTIDSARIVIGLGPGFTAGHNCHAAVETDRGVDLGRVIYRGATQADTGIPAPVSGKTVERVLRSPSDGVFRADKEIGDQVKTGESVGHVNGWPVECRIGGIVRGIIHDGTPVKKSQKIGDIDPRGIREICFKVSDKANAVAGGVLEAIFARRYSNNFKGEANGEKRRFFQDRAIQGSGPDNERPGA